MFGDIGYLLDIEHDERMIRAVIHFWDPYYRCFTFNEMDMTPTIEEYTALLRHELKTPDKIYLPQTGSKRKLARMMDVPTSKVDSLFKRKGEDECIHESRLFEFIQQYEKDEKSPHGMALAIYGLVVFPHAQGYISNEVIDLVEQMKYGTNLVPTIIAETIRSLNFCRIEGGGRFKGCIQLFHVWLKSHLQSRQTYFAPVNKRESIPLQEFQSAVWDFKLSKDGWIEFFKLLTNREVVWKAPWMPHEPALFRCGNYPWVPLMGLWGGVSYAPAMVRRQFGSEQFIPLTHGLSQFKFAYTDPEADQFKNEIIKAWKRTYRVRTGNYVDSTTHVYLAWQASRKKGLGKLNVHGPNLPIRMADDPQDIQAEIKYRYEMASRKLQVENENLLKENEKMKGEASYWKEQVEQADKKIRHLQRYMAGVNEQEIERMQLCQDIEQLNQKVHGLESMIRSSQISLKKCMKERDEALNINFSYQARMSNLVIERNQAQSLSRNLTLEHSHMAEAKLCLENMVQMLNQEIQRQQDEIQSLIADCNTLMAETNNLRNVQDLYEALSDQVEHSVDEIRGMTKKAREVADEVINLRAILVPKDTQRELISFLDNLYEELRYVGRFH